MSVLEYINFLAGRKKDNNLWFYQAVMRLQASHAPVVASDFLPKYPLLV